MNAQEAIEEMQREVDIYTELVDSHTASIMEAEANHDTPLASHYKRLFADAQFKLEYLSIALASTAFLHNDLISGLVDDGIPYLKIERNIMIRTDSYTLVDIGLRDREGEE